MAGGHGVSARLRTACRDHPIPNALKATELLASKRLTSMFCELHPRDKEMGEALLDPEWQGPAGVCGGVVTRCIPNVIVLLTPASRGSCRAGGGGIQSWLLTSAAETPGTAGPATLFCGGWGCWPSSATRPLPGHPAVPGRPACLVQVYVSLIKIKMSEGQRCTKSHFY